MLLAVVGILCLSATDDGRITRHVVPPADRSVCTRCPPQLDSIRLVRPRPHSATAQHFPFVASHLFALDAIRAAPPEAVGPIVRAALSVLAHALFLLAQFWAPALGWRLHFAREADVAAATHAVVQPSAVRAVPALVALERDHTRVLLHWQHQRLSARLPDAARADDAPSPSPSPSPPPSPCLAADLAFAEPALPTGKPVRWYVRRDGVSSAEHRRLLELHGPNACTVPPPDVRALLARQLLAPMTIIQISTALLWCLDAEPGRAAMGVFSALSFEASAALASYRSALAVHRLFRPPPPLLVRRNGIWAAAPARSLCPGELFSLVAGARVPCDAVLLRGCALVDESSLTGEAVPQPKEGLDTLALALAPPRARARGDAAAADEPDAAVLDDSTAGAHAGSALRGGTRVLHVDAPLAAAVARASTPPPPPPRRTKRPADDAAEAADGGAAAAGDAAVPPDGGVPCVALRTGHRSAHGLALRAAARGADSTPASADDARESLVLVALLLVAGAGASAYVATHATPAAGGGAAAERALYVHCALILLSVLPADLPAQAALSVGAGVRSLRAHGVLCVEPAALPAASHVRCVAFDKTGTLILDTPRLSGVLSAAALGGGALAVERAPLAARLVLAGCHALVPPAAAAEGAADAAARARAASPSAALGDPIEKAALEALGCRLGADGRRTELPLHAPPRAGTAEARAQLETLRREPFTPARRRMAAVVRVGAAGGAGAARLEGVWVLVKGAPEAVARLCADLPADFAPAHAAAAARGERVLALAARRLSRSEAAAVAAGTLRVADVERRLQLCGLALFRSEPHPDSAAAVRQLRAAGLRACVITGDALGTAVWAARACGVVRPKARVAVLCGTAAPSAAEPAGALLFAELARATGEPRPGRARRVAATRDAVGALARRCSLATTGEAYDAALAALPAARAALAPHLAVLARVDPAGKARAIQLIEACGERCLMVGDGANDAAALQAATCGLALLSAAPPAGAAAERATAAHAAARADAAALARLQTEMAAAFRAGAYAAGLDAGRRLAAAQEAAKAKALARRARERAERIAEGEPPPGPLSGLMEGFDQLLGASADDADGGALASAGEASMAAPFSARPGTPLAAVSLIRHARAALGHAVQTRALLCLHGLSAAGALSALHLRGIRYGRAHLLACNVVSLACGAAGAFPTLRPTLSRAVPIASVLDPALASSLALQALTHCATMAGALALGAAEDAARLARAGGADVAGAPPPSAPPRFVLGAPARPFAPSAINSAVICVELAQCVSIAALSSRLSHPPKARRRALARSFRLIDVALVVAGSGLVPGLSQLLQLQHPASARFRALIVVLVVADRLGAALCDELARRMFARRPLVAATRDAGERRADS